MPQSSSSVDWASKAHQRIFRNKVLFKWDTSPGLEHHCGICASPLNNTRAKSSCVGNHVEPCYRFHQQLHFVGKSHDCKSCYHAHEMHYARHKGMLKILRKLAEVDEEVARFLVDKIGLPTPNAKNPQASPPRPNDDPKPSNWSSNQSRSRKKMTKKTGVLDASNRWQEVEAFSQKDTNFIGSAIHLVVDGGKGAWEGKNTCDAFSYQGEPTQAYDVTGTKGHAKSIESPDLNYDLTVRNNKQRKAAKKVIAIKKASFLHTKMKGQSPKKGKEELLEGLDPQIFVRLGIKDIDPHKSSAMRKELIRKLIAQVKEDLMIEIQEKAEASLREEGFWKWAGKGAYNHMMKNRESVDWATGVLKSKNDSKTRLQSLPPPIPEETNEAEDDVEIDGTADDYAIPDDDMTRDEADLEPTPAAANTADHQDIVALLDNIKLENKDVNEKVVTRNSDVRNNGKKNKV